MNYFELFSFPLTFTLDEASLKQRYFELQREYHPDKAGLEGAQKSMELNQAYQTLMDPLKRAQYLLSLHDIDVGNDDSRVKPGMELLEEMMEKREAVMEVESAEAAKALLEQAARVYEKELERFTELAQKLPPACGGAGGGAQLETDGNNGAEITALPNVPISTDPTVTQSPPPAPPQAGGGNENIAQSLLRLQYITKWQAEIKQQMKRIA